nr:heme exporter protein CcmD [Oceanococcus sp. HetDA_MAG_MS8]
MTEFLAMGGYAKYLWPSMGLFVALLLGLAWSSVQRHQRTVTRLRQQLGRRT